MDFQFSIIVVIYYCTPCCNAHGWKKCLGFFSGRRGGVSPHRAPGKFLKQYGMSVRDEIFMAVTK